ncbi:MAG: helicase C-terminal domain-containing protein [Dehalococcoidia bacterium]|nr:helicase C-terminal domain-containing protein [Dehalococcoidia bacterium]
MIDEILVSLDLETTGLSQQDDAIMEIGAVKFQGDREIETFDTLVNPHRPLSYRIHMLTGISQAELDSAPDFSEVAGRLAAFIGHHPIVGQNINFDLEFLRAQGLNFDNTVHDILDVASVLLPELQDYTLGSLAMELGVSSPVQHRALADAITVKGVLLALVRRASALDLPTLAEINRLAASSSWSWRPLFLDLERAKVSKTSLWERQAWAGDYTPRPASVPDRKPLRPEEVIRPLDLKWLTAFLSDGGPMASAFPGFEYRPGQVSMMKKVAQTLNDGGQAIVEAGTGIGKSIAYLLPSIVFALENSTPVVVSTNTINLQEQLMTKDIPDLLRVLAKAGGKRRYAGPDLHIAQLKGRSNYLCLRRWNAWRETPGLPWDEARFLLRLVLWVNSTSSGDRAELNLSRAEAELWHRVSASEDNCVTTRCSYYPSGCFLYRARQMAQGAHVIVVNHALLLSDIARSGGLLPEYRHLIIDEAHRLEDEATDQLGFEVSEHDIYDCLGQFADKGGIGFRLRAYLRNAAITTSRRKALNESLRDMQESANSARARAAELVEILGSFLQTGHRGSRADYEINLRITGAVRGQTAWTDVEARWENLDLELAGADKNLGDLYALTEDLTDAKSIEMIGLLGEMSSLKQWIGTLRAQLRSAISKPEHKVIYWIVLNPQYGLSIHAAPLHVGEILEKTLFSQKDSVVLTSATLTAGGNFGYVKNALGITEADELVIEAPFDYKSSAMIYLPNDIPEPETPGYQQGVAVALTELCRATRGRMLVLFTSHAALRTAHAAVQEPLGQEGILVLGQGIDGSPKRLLNHLRTNPDTVVFGTSAMWEGVDVVGKALSVLVITRLPFAVPTDPVFSARAEMFDDPFNEYMVPQAVLRFKQGFGRLIRSWTDRGVLVILDRRVQTKSYGRIFLDSLPKCTVKRGGLRQMPQEVVDWLGE